MSSTCLLFTVCSLWVYVFYSFYICGFSKATLRCYTYICDGIIFCCFYTELLRNSGEKRRWHIITTYHIFVDPSLQKYSYSKSFVIADIMGVLACNFSNFCLSILSGKFQNVKIKVKLSKQKNQFVKYWELKTLRNWEKFTIPIFS